MLLCLFRESAPLPSPLIVRLPLHLRTYAPTWSPSVSACSDLLSAFRRSFREMKNPDRTTDPGCQQRVSHAHAHLSGKRIGGPDVAAVTPVGI